MSNIKISVEHNKVNYKKFTEEQLQYLDYERMNETITKIEFPTVKQVGNDIMEDKYYKYIALFLKQQYKLPVKYLKPDIDSCSYISQKSIIIGNTKNITDASITIEPLNQNVFKQISYTPINQAFDIGTVISLHENIPYINEDCTTPSRKLLTSASLVCSQYPKDTFKHNDKEYKTEYKGLCNRCIPYTAIDIGSEIIGKFIISTTDLRESMAIYKFRRPADNIIEIVTPDYINVSFAYIMDLTKETINKREYTKEQKEEFNKITENIMQEYSKHK